MRKWALAAGIVIVSAACGWGIPAETTSTGAPVPTSTTTTVSRVTTLAVTSTTSDVTTTTTGEGEVDVSFSAGEVSGPESFQVAVGETVDIWVLSDVDDEMHVHGYDLFHDLVAGVPFHLTFAADVPGFFEVEVHTGHTRLFEIEVSG